jgi:hypothetical protein
MKGSEGVAVYVIVYCCSLEKTMHLQDALCVPGAIHVPVEEAVQSVLDKDSIMFPLHGLPFIFRNVVLKSGLISCDQPGKEAFGVLIVICEKLYSIVASSCAVVLVSGLMAHGVHTLFSF